jgi:hypothetical protein
MLRGVVWEVRRVVRKVPLFRKVVLWSSSLMRGVLLPVKAPSLPSL